MKNSKRIIFIVILAVLLLGGFAFFLFAKFSPALWAPFGPAPITPQDIGVSPPPPLPPPSSEEDDDAPQPSAPLLPAVNATNFPLALPDGFHFSFFATDLGPARVMVFDPAGVLLVSVTKDGRVLALPDKNSDGRTDAVRVLFSDLDRPHGLAFKQDQDGAWWLYVAESSQVFRVRYDVSETAAMGERETVVALPPGGGHFTRTISFLGDNLLVSIGSSCDVCYETDERRAIVLIIDLVTKQWRVFAKGLRNTVFFVTHPSSGEVWGTDMGRDWLGDELPPDELNIITEGKDYGWPLCYGARVHDTEFDKNMYVQDPCEDTEPAVYDIPAHSAPLGLRFIESSQFSQAWQGDLLVAYHGSWNRSKPTGYKVVRLDVEGNTVVGAHDFISGWFVDGAAVGRPVDLLFDNQGTLFISDDKAGVIYRMERL